MNNKLYLTYDEGYKRGREDYAEHKLYFPDRWAKEGELGFCDFEKGYYNGYHGVTNTRRYGVS